MKIFNRLPQININICDGKKKKMKKTQSITVESLPVLKKEMPLSSPEYRGCFQFARFVSGFSLPRQMITI